MKRKEHKLIYVNIDAMCVHVTPEQKFTATNLRLALLLPGSHITKTTTKSTDPLTLLWIMTQIQAQR